MGVPLWVVWGGNIYCQCKNQFFTFSRLTTASTWCCFAPLLCEESDTKTFVTVNLVCMLFFTSALKFLAKCDLVCVKFKMMNKLVPNFAQSVFSPFIWLALLVRLVVEAVVDWYCRGHRVLKALLRNWLRLNVKLTGRNIKKFSVELDKFSVH